MNTLRKVQVVFLAAAALVFAIAVLIGLHVLPNHMINITIGGLHRIADTLLFFSIALGLVWLVFKKQ
jgi:hypothetical protein